MKIDREAPRLAGEEILGCLEQRQTTSRFRGDNRMNKLLLIDTSPPHTWHVDESLICGREDERLAKAAGQSVKDALPPDAHPPSTLRNPVNRVHVKTLCPNPQVWTTFSVQYRH